MIKVSQFLPSHAVDLRDAAETKALNTNLEEFTGEMSRVMHTHRKKGKTGWDDPTKIKHITQLLMFAVAEDRWVDVGLLASFLRNFQR